MQREHACLIDPVIRHGIQGNPLAPAQPHFLGGEDVLEDRHVRLSKLPLTHPREPAAICPQVVVKPFTKVRPHCIHLALEATRRVSGAQLAIDPQIPPLIAVMGPTASGKTSFAEALADQTGCQLINADAFQVYRGLDIGTAKSERRSDYLLMDLIEPTEDFGVGAWIRHAVAALEELARAGRGAIVVGGTLYYIRALFEEYADLREPPDPELRLALNRRTTEELNEELRARDPEAAATVDPANRVRVQRALERLESVPLRFTLPPFRKLKLGLDPDPAGLRDRIGLRVHRMVAEGWRQEVEELMVQGVPREAPGMRAHGYRAFWDVAAGASTLDEILPGIAVEVAQYAKRQRTWMRAEPNLVKMPNQDEGKALASALALLSGVI